MRLALAGISFHGFGVDCPGLCSCVTGVVQFTTPSWMTGQPAPELSSSAANLLLSMARTIKNNKTNKRERIVVGFPCRPE